jgi:nitrate reductase gamma subunit
MLYSTTFYLALSILVLGAVYRIAGWFTLKIGRDADRISVRLRLSNLAKGLLLLLFSRDIFRVMKTFFSNVIFQFHILRTDVWRWLMHFSLAAGFLLLFLMHALDDQITARLFSDYYPTVNPFLFLRNLFGTMVLIGIVIAACRRMASKRLKQLTTAPDVIALIILVVILF